MTYYEKAFYDGSLEFAVACISFSLNETQDAWEQYQLALRLMAIEEF